MVNAWDARTGVPIEPITDPAPQGKERQARSPDGKLLARINGDEVLVRRLDDMDRQEREEASLTLEWHLRTAFESERARQWFAAAFHLSRLLQQEPDNPALLLRRCLASAQLGRLKDAAADLVKACKVMTRQP